MKIKLEFCVLCWRNNHKKQYCSKHKASGETRSENLKISRRLKRCLKNRGIDIEHSPNKNANLLALHDAAYRLVMSPETALSYCSFGSLGFKKQAQQILKISSRYYPLSYLKLKQIDLAKIENKKEYADAVSRVFSSPVERNSPNQIYLSLEDPDAKIWGLKVLKLVARYEALKAINEAEIKPGPIKGTNADVTIRERLRKRIDELDSTGENYTLKKLGEEFSLSPSRICELRKSLKQKRYYRK